MILQHFTTNVKWKSGCGQPVGWMKTIWKPPVGYVRSWTKDSVENENRFLCESQVYFPPTATRLLWIASQKNPVVVQIVHQSRDRLSLSLVACTFPTKLCLFRQIISFGETIDKWVVTYLVKRPKRMMKIIWRRMSAGMWMDIPHGFLVCSIWPILPKPILTLFWELWWFYLTPGLMRSLVQRAPQVTAYWSVPAIPLLWLSWSYWFLKNTFVSCLNGQI